MTTTKIAVGPLAPSAKGRATYRPAVRGAITGGLWAERRRINRETSLLAGWDQLVAAGNIHDLELAAGRATGEYANDRLPFMDSDVYKWAEAAAWALADPETSPALASELTSLLAKLTELLQAAQAEDGYLDSYFQVKHPGERFAQLAWGHELYCAGHLIQAAVALRRTTGDTGLLTIATRLADLISKTFGLGPSQKDGICGHPEIETALVGLFRETGEQRYLDTALFFVDRRGHGLLSDGHFALYYFQDRTPVRDAVVVEGHAVRQLYLLAGVADLAVETEDPQLLAAAERLWTDMVATKTYLTGGIGAHHKDESFGAPYELPNERSYCETCAAIASIQFSWRMLAVTGEAKYADLIERTLYNGFLAGVSLDGQRYIYANPLQVRDGQTVRGDDGDYERVPWFHCACCPPNVMRLLASLEHYVALARPGRVLLHQYLPGRYTVAVSDGEATLEVATDYPFDGRITVKVGLVTTAGRWDLALRAPAWANSVSATLNGQAVETATADGWLTLSSTWASGDEVILELGMPPRFTMADPRVDAARGAVALERGPLVYCVESADNAGLPLDQIVIDTNAEPEITLADPALGDIPAIGLGGGVRVPGSKEWWPYRPSAASEAIAGEARLTAIPYFAWGNRQRGAMRVWIPCKW